MVGQRNDFRNLACGNVKDGNLLRRGLSYKQVLALIVSHERQWREIFSAGLGSKQEGAEANKYQKHAYPHFYLVHLSLSFGHIEFPL